MSDQRTGQADTAPQAHIDAVADHVHELIPDQWLIDELVRRGALTEVWRWHNESVRGIYGSSAYGPERTERPHIYEDDTLEHRLVTRWEPTP